MNKEEEHILSLPAGRELDVRVLMGFFGVMAFRDSNGQPYKIGAFQENEPVPQYSTDINAAFGVYEKLVADCTPNSGEPDFIMLNAYPDGTFYIAKVWAHHDGDIVEFELTADSFPLAVCKLALTLVLRNL